ncbi:MAG TPA: MmgE/PrpD family protein, partial [Clostridiaceae bacterium]|nr:MmgE/PrpD family protein [Clostridiaceae bacterium]
QRGYHATGTCGMLGIAIASSYALDFDIGQTRKALSTAAVSATGTLKVLEDGSQLKPYNVAKAALLGLTAVQMAQAGFEVADDSFSGVAGFLNQMYGSDAVDFMPVMLNGSYAIEKAYIKPYAACRYTHPAIDIAKDLRNRINLAADDIESVKISTYSLAVKKHDHTDIPGAASAKMSIPYNFAVAYIADKTGMEAFEDDCIFNEEISILTKKVTVEANDEMSALFPAKTIATVEILANDGRRFEGRNELPKGEPENPLTHNEVIEKFTGLAVYGGKTKKQTEQIVDAVLNLETELPQLLEMLK